MQMPDHQLLTSLSMFANWTLTGSDAWQSVFQNLMVLDRLRRPLDTVVCAGAYTGTECYLYATVFKNIVMFEPNKELADFVGENFSNSEGRFDATWAIHNMALCSEDAVKPFFKILHGDTNVSSPKSGFHNSYEGEQQHICETIMVHTMPLDKFNIKPTLIQLDVEGHEEEAITGALETIKEFRPLIQLESVPNDLGSLLESLGYGPVSRLFPKSDIVYAHETDLSLLR